MAKHLLVVILLLITGGFVGRYFEPGNPILTIFIILIVVFFIFNLMVRKSLSFRNYFASKYNPLTTKFRLEKSFDIPRELMFEKIIEVINSSGFKIVDSDKDTFEILAITTTTFKSWGENIYISFTTKGNQTIMNFCSSTLFQVYSWGKNEKNYDDLLNEFESSLTI